MLDCDVAVVGGGTIGIAVARALALSGERVVLLERETRPLHHTSSRNSEVIHAGLYYAAGSWKARLCAPGRRILYDYLQARRLPHRRSGKLVVAVEAEELDKLAEVRAIAERNGVESIAWLDRAALAEHAPQVRAQAALHVPVSGIFDSHAYAMAMLAEAESADVAVAWRQTVIEMRAGEDGVAVDCVDRGDGDVTTLYAGRVVNCAGHGAPAVYHSTYGLGARRPYTPVYAKGNYAAVSGPAPASTLIYPLPQQYSLGIHVTLDLAGRVRLGPDLEWVECSDDYAVEADYAERARAAAARYWPAVAQRSIRPDYAGVRPKLCLDGTLLNDFVFEREPAKGPWRVLHCLGIESPGLTCSLAIGAIVAGRPQEAGLPDALAF